MKLKYFPYKAFWLGISALLLFLVACEQEQQLPFYGKYPVKTASGYDTIIKTIAPFEFYDQDSVLVDNGTFKNHIYVADFFFTSCPTICPVMKRQMLRIYDHFEDNNEVLLLSHTIDPQRDTVKKLKEHSEKLGVSNNEKWHFVTGYKDELYLMAEEYMITAYEDGELPGGFEHSGQFILVDKNGMVRGYYDGTNEDAVTKLMMDMEILLDEK